MREVNTEDPMMKPSSTERRGLIVREPFIELILSGRKRYEFRTRPTRYRGRIVLVWRGRAYGSVKLADSTPLNPTEALRLATDEERRFLLKYVNGRDRIFAWKLEEPIRFEEPVPVSIRRGARVWVRLKERDVKKILGAEATSKGKGKEGRDTKVQF